MKYLIALNFQDYRLFVRDSFEHERHGLTISASIVSAKQVSVVEMQEITRELRLRFPNVEFFPTDLSGEPLRFLDCALELQGMVQSSIAQDLTRSFSHDSH